MKQFTVKFLRIANHQATGVLLFMSCITLALVSSGIVSLVSVFAAGVAFGFYYFERNRKRIFL